MTAKRSTVPHIMTPLSNLLIFITFAMATREVLPIVSLLAELKDKKILRIPGFQDNLQLIVTLARRPSVSASPDYRTRKLRHGSSLAGLQQLELYSTVW